MTTRLLEGTSSAARTSAATVPMRKQRANRLQPYAVPVAAAVAVLARLPFLAADPSKDEAGFLMVGQQWHSAGASLYGNYWVDRPPLLITIFRVADQLGGLLPLRLIGCVATVLIVLGAARVARRLGGPRAAAWAALTAAAMCVSPLLGGQSVNGELLAAPFVVGGIAAVLTTVDHPSEGRSALSAGLAGAATMAAVLVKQNMADVAVFAGVVLLLAWWRGEITSPRLIRSVVGYVSGAVLCLSVVAAWTMAHGTSLVGVFDAMYPFRIEAVHVMAASNRQAADARLWVLLTSWAISGGAVIMGVVTWALLSSRLRGAAVWGLIATVLFDVVSIAVGGSYWSHYLIQLVVPTAVISGLLVSSRAPAARTVLTSAALAAAIAVGGALPGTHTSIGSAVGQAVGRVAGPRDTIVTAWGHADLTRASGLGSPYPYLWSLPARTLDPRYAALDELLSGPRAPTWFVTWNSVHSWVGHPHRVVIARLLAARYHPVAHLDGRTVYLRRGVERATPRLSRAKARHPDSPDVLSSATSPKETP